MASAMMRTAAFGSTVGVRARVHVVPRIAPAPVSRSVVQVVRAAGDDKKDKKAQVRMDSAVKRAKLGEERRMYNKARKSACATRIKKVIKAAEKAMADVPKAEADIAPIEKLVAEAYQEIDKAVSKGVLHKNNAARKKSRVARYKRLVLIKAGLFTPSADHPDFKAAQRLTQKKVQA